MGFAEQLAARAAEKSSHQHTHKTPPRLATITNKGNTKTVASSSSSPFAEQLRKSALSSSLNSRSSTAATLDYNDNNDDDSSHLSSQSAQSKKHSSSSSQRSNILIPTTNGSYEEEEEDEYASVGFSLTIGSSTSSTATATKAEDGENKGKDEGRRGGEGELDLKSLPTFKRKKKKLQPISTVATSTISVGESSQDESQIINNNNTRRIPNKDINRHYSLQNTNSTPHDQGLDCIIQSSSTHKSDTNHNIISNSNSNAQVFGAWAQIEQLKQKVQEAELRARKESQRAEIVSHELQRIKEGQQEQKVHGGERHPRVHGEVGEFSMGGETEHEQVPTVHAASSKGRGRNHQASDDKSTATASVQGSHHDHDDNDGETNIENHHSPQHDQQCDKEEVAEALLWKKRALEAEERLAKEVERLQRTAATSTTTNNNNATATSDPEIISLKNAEIGVLRSQIQRLERRLLQVEYERSNELVRMSSSYHRDDSLVAPPLVVASECTTSSSTTRSNNNHMDEFELLRNEIRHLQYQLHANGRGGGGGGGATTTSTGESTLSTFENDYTVNVNRSSNTNRNDDEVSVDDDEEGEENDNNCSGGGNAIVAPPSSWYCCFFRGGGVGSSRSKRGYGRV